VYSEANFREKYFFSLQIFLQFQIFNVNRPDGPCDNRLDG
jgi:hypothetical protein